MHTLITNIGQLVAVPPGPVAGAAMARVPTISDAALLIEGERIAWFGTMAELHTKRANAGQSRQQSDSASRNSTRSEHEALQSEHEALASGLPHSAFASPDQTIDATGNCVIPGLIDCHTHTVFAGSREREWVQKIEGRTYLEILESGGGIHSTVSAVRAATLDELVNAARPRLQRMLAGGVTTVEIKSGYGLTVEDELKMLRAAKILAADLPMEIVGTYLAAHTIPKEFAGRADAYLEAVTAPTVLEAIQREGLAEFADVFCERGAFTVEQSERFLRACAAHGLRPKVHADQLSQMGASRMAARVGAISADHLEFTDDESIDAMRAAGTIPVLLPGCSLFLNSPPADARKFIRAGLPVALATDFNPGSCRIESLPLIMSLGCTMLRLTPLESLVACTANAAAALGRADRIGTISVGHQADLVILDVPNAERMCCEVGRNCVRKVIKAGLAT